MFCILNVDRLWIHSETLVDFYSVCVCMYGEREKRQAVTLSSLCSAFLLLLLGCYGNSSLRGGLAILFQVSPWTLPLLWQNNYSPSWFFNPQDADLMSFRPNWTTGLHEVHVESSTFTVNDPRFHHRSDSHYYYQTHKCKSCMKVSPINKSKCGLFCVCCNKKQGINWLCLLLTSFSILKPPKKYG